MNKIWINSAENNDNEHRYDGQNFAFSAQKPLPSTAARWAIQTTRQHHYSVRMVPPLVNEGLSELADTMGTKKALIVTTPTVYRLYSADIFEQLKSYDLDVALQVLKCNEATKSVSEVEEICKNAIQQNLGRNDLLISIGGGVCSDLVTVAASWIRRGIRHVRIPTTLIGQIDAAIGIKGAVNFQNKKSYIGCFHAPADVLIDPTLLTSLSADNIRCGLSEILKIALILDQNLYQLLEQCGDEFIKSRGQNVDASRDEILWRAIEGMVGQLEPNLFEDQTLERLVDFGHTFSPLLESASRFVMPHGYAVAIDMALSSAISCELGMLEKSDLDSMLALLHALGLPTYSPLLTQSLCQESITTASAHRGGSLNLAVPIGIGQGEFIRSETQLSDKVMTCALESIKPCAVSDSGSLSVAHE